MSARRIFDLRSQVGLACFKPMNIELFIEQLSWGAMLTVAISFASGIGALLIAPLVGLARLSKFRCIRIVASIYVEFFRGTSLLVQLFWIFFVLPLFGLRLVPFVAAAAGISLNFGAYGAENCTRQYFECTGRADRSGAFTRFAAIARVRTCDRTTSLPDRNSRL